MPIAPVWERETSRTIRIIWGLLGGFLGELEVAKEADQAGEDAGPLLAEDPLRDYS